MAVGTYAWVCMYVNAQMQSVRMHLWMYLWALLFVCMCPCVCVRVSALLVTIGKCYRYTVPLGYNHQLCQVCGVAMQDVSPSPGSLQLLGFSTVDHSCN